MSRRSKVMTFTACCRCCRGSSVARMVGSGPRGGSRHRGSPNQQRESCRPTTGDFDLEVPGQSLESLEVLASPFAAEYGRFSTSVVQIRTRRATNEWEIKPGYLIPRFSKGLTAVRAFEPRFSVRGPIKRDRVLLAQDFQYRYANDRGQEPAR